ncbi:hypothetical protein PoB_001204700 [Plakobranchus ocellatus]|uniref:Uncharacterized protein n=1 Tax=Plakobranchus ocellatus TaxID=259542 RepID=A0AAV3YSW5_9GAST|nr:hypothetical protein PoB_001204700 [Plakobranchus ocellatus]
MVAGSDVARQQGNIALVIYTTQSVAESHEADADPDFLPVERSEKRRLQNSDEDMFLLPGIRDSLDSLPNQNERIFLHLFKAETGFTACHAEKAA